MQGPEIAWYLVVAGILFSIGVAGVLLRRSPLIILLSLEIMLNAGNLALGATRYPREYGPDDDFVVLVDPDGNRFCVVRKTDSPSMAPAAA